MRGDSARESVARGASPCNRPRHSRATVGKAPGLNDQDRDARAGAHRMAENGGEPPELAALQAADRISRATSRRTGSRTSRGNSARGAARSRRRDVPIEAPGRKRRSGADRGLAPCPHRPPCSACPRFGERGIAPGAERALGELAKAHGLPKVAIVSGSYAGFRLRARLAIRGRLGSPKLGLFELGSHRVVHIPNCRVHHPLINHVANVVRRALVEARITSYSDKAHAGIARYLQVVVERASQSAQVVIVAHSASVEPLAGCCALIRERLGGDLHSLWFNSNLEPTNIIMARHSRIWADRQPWWKASAGPPFTIPRRLRSEQSGHRAAHHRARA